MKKTGHCAAAPHGARVARGPSGIARPDPEFAVLEARAGVASRVFLARAPAFSLARALQKLAKVGLPCISVGFAWFLGWPCISLGWFPLVGPAFFLVSMVKRSK